MVDNVFQRDLISVRFGSKRESNDLPVGPKGPASRSRPWLIHGSMLNPAWLHTSRLIIVSGTSPPMQLEEKKETYLSKQIGMVKIDHQGPSSLVQDNNSKGQFDTLARCLHDMSDSKLSTHLNGCIQMPMIILRVIRKFPLCMQFQRLHARISREDSKLTETIKVHIVESPKIVCKFYWETY